jgi:hypothetical protein
MVDSSFSADYVGPPRAARGLQLTHEPPHWRVPSGHSRGAPAAQATSQPPPALRQSTTQAPSQVTWQLPTRSQVTLLPGPTRGVQLETSRQE